MAIIYPVYRYEDGHWDEGPAFRRHEHYGLGQVRDHDGRRWKAVEREMIEDDPNRFRVFFDPDE